MPSGSGRSPVRMFRRAKPLPKRRPRAKSPPPAAIPPGLKLWGGASLKALFSAELDECLPRGRRHHPKTAK